MMVHHCGVHLRVRPAVPDVQPLPPKLNSIIHTEGLKHEAGQVAKAHENVAKNLDKMVLEPFTTWSQQHEGRIIDLKHQLKEAYDDWEGLSSEVCRQLYRMMSTSYFK